MVKKYTTTIKYETLDLEKGLKFACVEVGIGGL